MTNPAEIFQRYRSERRAQRYPGFEFEELPHLSRYTAIATGENGWVAFANLSPADVPRVIDEQIRHFERHSQGFEWKVYDLDAPSNLKALLEERGFASEDTEAFMVLPAADWPPRVPDPAVRIEQVGLSQLAAFVGVESAIWPDTSGHLERYTRELETRPGETMIFCAYVDGAPVGTGRVSFRPEASFADLNGGGVIPSMRGRGVFTALLSRRIEEAKTRGYRWVAIDAAPMSRPILLRRGFQHVCWTYPMLRSARPDAS